jgi:hypothetical protein
LTNKNSKSFLGDPRKEESLHHFSKDKMNVYEKSISKICTILSEYDSDQKYPVWGFGGKRNGKIDHCFRCGEQEEADGVTGILEAYKQAFKAGIAMSSPTNITEVIRAAGKNARKCLVRIKQSFWFVCLPVAQSNRLCLIYVMLGYCNGIRQSRILNFDYIHERVCP